MGREAEFCKMLSTSCLCDLVLMLISCFPPRQSNSLHLFSHLPQATPTSVVHAEKLPVGVLLPTAQAVMGTLSL
ncbi:hypothetical protein EYF80_014852 [Liparis tanakae]|uniref:Uncharacterized protein n=1 Tax=Liparis tanakae TaxID=230148 RepID=A0A4Z2IC63_9TELE|nr:hypothetical protein EYF80_014852 [Liparis tanakae]